MSDHLMELKEQFGDPLWIDPDVIYAVGGGDNATVSLTTGESYRVAETAEQVATMRIELLRGRFMTAKN